MKIYLYIAFALLIFVSCGAKKQYMVTSMTGSYLPVETTDDPDRELTAFLAPYKSILDREMKKVIGHSALYMTTGRPESLLTNLTSDFMWELESSFNDGAAIDLALMNVYGIRAPIAEGEITLGDMFNVYSFDNSLVIVSLEGKYLTEVFKSYARMGGAGISKNVKLTVKDTELVEALVNGKPVDESKIYTIVTLDYLAEGNDGMEALLHAIDVKYTDLILRDYMVQRIRKLEEQGEKLTSALDGRITILGQ